MPRKPQNVFEPHQGEHVPTELYGFPVLHRLDVLLFHSHHAFHIGCGKDEGKFAHPYEKPLKGSECRGHHKAERGPTIGVCAKGDNTPEVFQLLLHDGKTESPA
jgi:hypothetical protein